MNRRTLMNCLAATAYSALLIGGIGPRAATAATYIWANSNVTGTPTSPLDWLSGGPNTQGTWTGGTPVSSNLNTIQFFADITTALGNTAAATQTSNINNGGSAFVLGILTLDGKGSGTAANTLTMTISGDPLDFSGATGTINLSAVNGSTTITYNVNSAIQLGTMSSADALTLTGNGSATFNIGGNISELQAGGGSLIKTGSSIVNLSGTNSYSGGTTISGGILEVGADGNLGATSGGIAFSGTSALQSTALTLSLASTRTITVNTGWIAVFQAIHANSPGKQFTVAGKITGDGGIQAFDDYTLGQYNVYATNTGNDFKGSIGIGNLTTQGGQVSLHIASLVDDATHNGNIIFGFVGISPLFDYTGSSNLTLNNRQIQLASTKGGTIQTSGSGSLTINTNLLVSGSGAQTLTLTGSSGSNIFAGNIANGGSSALKIAKTGVGAWTISGNMTNSGGLTISNAGVLNLSGANTYSGGTTLNSGGSGTLVYQGIQALSSNSAITQNQVSTGGSTIKLLDDSAGTNGTANATTVNFTLNTVNGNGIGNQANAIFVGNNSTANGGSNSSSTVTGETISVGKLTMTSNTTSGGSDTIGWNTISGANGYRLQINSVDLPSTAGLAHAVAAYFVPSTATVTLAGTIRQLAGNPANQLTLQLDGTSTGNQVTGNILDATDALTTGKPLNVTKSSTSTWTLSGNNTYTGATTISAGTLGLGNGGNLLGSATVGSAVSVTGALAISQNASGASNAIGQSGQTTAASVTLNAGAALNMNDGYTSTLNMVGAATLSSGAGAATTLTFNTGASTTDLLAITGAGTNSNSTNKTVINIVPIANPTSASNTYTIITAGSGLTPGNFTLATSPNVGIGGSAYHFQLDASSSATQEVVSLVSGAISPVNAYWYSNTGGTGGAGTPQSWAAVYGDATTNFSSNASAATNTYAVPVSTTNVFVSANTASNLSSMTLDQAFSILSLTFTGTGTSNTGGSTLAAGSGGTLTIGTGGITVNAGSGANTISAPVTLGGVQSWTNNSGSLLTVGPGAITNAANTLTIAGLGNTTISGNIGSGSGGLTVNASGAIVTLTGTNAYTGATTLTAGTLVANNATSPLGGSTSALKLNGGTLDLQTNGAAYSTTVGGATTIQSDNASSGPGTNQILGALSIGAFQLNVAPGAYATGSTAAITFGATTLTGAGTFDVAANSTLNLGAVGGAFGFTKQNSGTLILSAGNTFGTGTAGLTLSAGLVKLSGVYSSGSSSGALLTVNGGTLDVNGNQAQSGNFTGTGGTILNNATGTNVQLVIGGNNVSGGNFAGTIANHSSGTGTIALTQVGATTFTLSGSNTYTGATTITSSGSDLILSNINAIANSSSVSIASGSSLQLNAGGTYATAGNISITGTGKSGLTNSGALYFGVGGTITTTLNAPIALGGATTISSYGNIMTQTLGGAIGETGPLTISGQGGTTSDYSVWTLGTASNYSGNTVIKNNNSNTDTGVKLGADNALPTSTSLNLTGALAQAVASFTTLDLNGHSQTLAGLTDAGSTDSNAAKFGARVINSGGTLATLTINNAGPDTYGLTGTTNVLPGTIGGLTPTWAGGAAANNLALTKTGAGTLTLSGANTYTGGTTLNQGTLTIGTGGTLGATTGAITVNNNNTSGAGTNAILNLATAVDTTVGGLSGAISTPTSGTNTATINNGGSGRNFTVNQTVAGTYSGVIAGGGNFTLGSLSTNTLTLSGANTYSGTTSVTAGTLRVTNTSGSATGTNTVSVSSGAYLGGGAGPTVGQIGGLVTINTGGHLAPNGLTGTVNNLTLNGGVTLSDSSFLDYKLGSASDLITIGNNSPLTLGKSVTLNITQGAGYASSLPVTYELISYGSSSVVTGDANLADSINHWNVVGGGSGAVFTFVDNTANHEIDLQITASAHSSAWNLAASGNYSVSTNWDGNIYANGAGQVATFAGGTTNTINSGTVSSPPIVVNNDIVSLTLGGMVFDNSTVGYTLSGNSVTLNNNNAVGGVSIEVDHGIHHIVASNLTVTDNNGLTFNPTISGDLLTVSGTINSNGKPLAVLNTSSGNITLNGAVSGGGSLTMNGAGTLTLGAANSFSNTSVTAGTLTTTASGALGSGSLKIGAAAVNLGGNESNVTTLSMTAGSLRIAAGNTLTITPTATASAAGAITLANGSGMAAGGALVQNANTLEVNGAMTLGGNSAVTVNNSAILKLNVTSGMPAVGTGVTVTVNNSASLELAGTTSALTDTSAPIQRASIVNNSTATAGVDVLDGAAQQVGGIDGSGGVVVEDTTNSMHPTSLTADHINQTSLVIGAGSTFSLAPSDSNGNPMVSGGGFVLAGSLSPASGFVVSGGNLLGVGGASASPAVSLGGGVSGGTANAVPEPATVVLLLLGGLGIWPLVRRARVPG